MIQHLLKHIFNILAGAIGGQFCCSNYTKGAQKL
jgi:hypothetical protein